MQQKVTSTTAKGFIIGLIMAAISVGISFSGNSANNSLQWLVYLVFVIGIIFSVIQYGKQVEHNSTFGNYFAHGFKTSAVVTIVMIVFLIIFMTCFPEFKEKAIEQAKKGMEAKNNMSDDQKAKAIEMTRKLFMVFLIGGALIAYLLVGAIASLIGAAVTKKDPQVFQEEHIN